MPTITCNLEEPLRWDIHAVDPRVRLRFVLPFNAELLLYDDVSICRQVKRTFDALTDTEQRAYILAVITEKLSP